MKKLFLISSPRSGTNYFVQYLDSIQFIKSIRMRCEPLNADIEQAKRDINHIDNSLSRLGFNFESRLYQLLKVREENTKLFFDEFLKYLNILALATKSDYYGFKIFQNHIENNLTLEYVIDQSDSLIVLDRNIKEIVFSYSQARRTHKWNVENRKVKIDNLILTENEMAIVINFIKDRKIFFENVNALISKKNKNALYIHYDDFATDGWQKVSDFLGVKLEKQIPFNKASYDYDDFFKNHPSIEKTINELYPSN